MHAQDSKQPPLGQTSIGNRPHTYIYTRLLRLAALRLVSWSWIPRETSCVLEGHMPEPDSQELCGSLGVIGEDLVLGRAWGTSGGPGWSWGVLGRLEVLGGFPSVFGRSLGGPWVIVRWSRDVIGIPVGDSWMPFVIWPHCKCKAAGFWLHTPACNGWQKSAKTCGWSLGLCGRVSEVVGKSVGALCTIT